MKKLLLNDVIKNLDVLYTWTTKYSKKEGIKIKFERYHGLRRNL